MKREEYNKKYPVIEIYKGYEIRNGGIDEYGIKSYICNAAIAIYGTMSTTLKGCYEFIDELVNAGIKQYDNEAVSKYIIRKL